MFHRRLKSVSSRRPFRSSKIYLASTFAVVGELFFFRLGLLFAVFLFAGCWLLFAGFRFAVSSFAGLLGQRPHEGHGREILEIPFATYSDTALGVDITNSAFPPTRFSTWNANPPDFMLRNLKLAFDALYERSAERAVMMPLVVHDFISGRPFRSKVFDDFVTYAKQFDGVVFTGHDQLAEWCRNMGEFGKE